MPALLIGDTNSRSRRTATVEETGSCAWLYLSKPDSTEIEKDVWLYNRIPAPSRDEIPKYRWEAPPAAKDYIFEPGTMGVPREQNFEFRWSDDGEAVAVWIFAELHAFILPESKHGYSRLLQTDCPWGHPIDFDAYDRHLKS